MNLFTDEEMQTQERKEGSEVHEVADACSGCRQLEGCQPQDKGQAHFNKSDRDQGKPGLDRGPVETVVKPTLQQDADQTGAKTEEKREGRIHTILDIFGQGYGLAEALPAMGRHIGYLHKK